MTVVRQKEVAAVHFTDRDDKDHSTLLARQLFTCCRQRGVPDRNELEPRRRLTLLGELQLVSFADVDAVQQPARPRLSVTSNSSFFFLSLFSMNSNQDLCLELVCGLSSLAFKPGGKGTVQSIRLPFRSLLCLSLAWLPVAAARSPFFSRPILNGSYQLTMLERAGNTVQQARRNQPPPEKLGPRTGGSRKQA